MRTVLSRLGIACASKGLPVSVSCERSENWYSDLQRSKKRFKCVFYLDFFLPISAVKENILYECQNPYTSSFRHTWADKTYKWTQRLVRNGTCHGEFWTLNFFLIKWVLACWIKIDQLDITRFIISLFNAQLVSDVSTSILRSLRLICWVISWVV